MISAKMLGSLLWEPKSTQETWSMGFGGACLSKKTEPTNVFFQLFRMLTWLGIPLIKSQVNFQKRIPLSILPLGMTYGNALLRENLCTNAHSRLSVSVLILNRLTLLNIL